MKNKSKILIVGDFKWPWYQEACANAIKKLNYDVVRFGWEKHYAYNNKSITKNIIKIASKVLTKLSINPKAFIANIKLLRFSLKTKPDIIWFYNVQIIYPITLKKIKKNVPLATFCQFANDNPFSKNSNHKIWKNYIKSIPYFNLHFSYRLNNIEDYHSYNAKNTYMLRSYFIPEEDYHIELKNIPKKFHCDVVFVGHYEDDGRIDFLEEIYNAGFKLNLFGPGWKKALANSKKNSVLRKLPPISAAMGRDYLHAICGAKVALCFLSTLNQDTYTRRNFQIPAMKTAMLSQRTKDLENLFQENVDCMFFSNKLELINKLTTLVNNDKIRENIALAGYKKVYQDGHDVDSRMRIFMNQIEEWNTKP